MIYGNPSYNSVQTIKHSLLLKEWNHLGVFDALKLMPYPGEMETIQELYHLLDLQKTVDDIRMRYIERVDKELFTVMSEWLASYGVTEDSMQIKHNLDLYDPIIDYLKVIYNRPRPFQTAGVYGVPLYPMLKTDASDSSYPGGHTLLALFFRHIYMQRHPELAKDMMHFVLDIAQTRLQGGVHYPSDNLFSMRVYKHIKPWMTAANTFYKGT
jgi:hypothetical protein